MKNKMIALLGVFSLAFVFMFGGFASQAEASTTNVDVSLSGSTLTIHGLNDAYVYVRLQKLVNGNYETQRGVTYKLDSRGYYYKDAATYSFEGYSITSGSYRYVVSQDQPYYSSDMVYFTK